MANYPQELAQDAVCQSHTGQMTGLWFLPTRSLRLNTNEWMNEWMNWYIMLYWVPGSRLYFMVLFALLMIYWWRYSGTRYSVNFHLTISARYLQNFGVRYFVMHFLHTVFFFLFIHCTFRTIRGRIPVIFHSTLERHAWELSAVASYMWSPVLKKHQETRCGNWSFLF